MTSVPIIDFAKWSSGDQNARSRIADELVSACHTVGFVAITNHGIPEDELQEAFAWSKKLFDLSHEEKMLAPHPHGYEVHRGYSYPGLEKVNQIVNSKDDDPELGSKLRQVQDCKESYEIGSESNPQQPNIWLPEAVLPGFRAFTTTFYWRCWESAKTILRAMALGLRLEDEEYFLRFHSGHNNQLRLLHYPPLPSDELTSGVKARMPAHSDWGSITMLFQDECGGLEVESPREPGVFIPIKPLRNALVLNVGDLLMRWSNDYLKSTLHKVTSPPLQDRSSGAVQMTRERYSIPYFVSPDPEALIECLRECTDASTPVKYEPVRQDEYRRMRGRLQYPSKDPAIPVA